MQLWSYEIANIQSIGVDCTSVINAVNFLLHISEGDQPIAIEGPDVGDHFCENGDLVEKDRLLIKERDVGIGIPGFDGAAVITSVEAIHPAALAVQPAVTQEFGGGEAAIHIGVDDVAVALTVSKVHVDVDVDERI